MVFGWGNKKQQQREVDTTPEIKQITITNVSITTTTNSTTNFDTILNTRVGSREYECTLSNVYQMDEVLGSIMVFHDVTKERELARMKTEFTSTVSHELRTPLTSILGFAKLITN